MARHAGKSATSSNRHCAVLGDLRLSEGESLAICGVVADDPAASVNQRSATAAADVASIPPLTIASRAPAAVLAFAINGGGARVIGGNQSLQPRLNGWIAGNIGIGLNYCSVVDWQRHLRYRGASAISNPDSRCTGSFRQRGRAVRQLASLPGTAQYSQRGSICINRSLIGAAEFLPLHSPLPIAQAGTSTNPAALGSAHFEARFLIARASRYQQGPPHRPCSSQMEGGLATLEIIRSNPPLELAFRRQAHLRHAAAGCSIEGSRDIIGIFNERSSSPLDDLRRWEEPPKMLHHVDPAEDAVSSRDDYLSPCGINRRWR